MITKFIIKLENKIQIISTISLSLGSKKFGQYSPGQKNDFTFYICIFFHLNGHARRLSQVYRINKILGEIIYEKSKQNFWGKIHITHKRKIKAENLLYFQRSGQIPYFNIIVFKQINGQGLRLYHLKIRGSHVKSATIYHSKYQISTLLVLFVLIECRKNNLNDAFRLYVLFLFTWIFYIIYVT